jgi:CheY-like chemotaxis protein
LNQNTTILIAEDNTINMLLIKEILSSTGANMIEATDGQEAYQKFLLHNPDLIFLDIHMPIMDGIEVAKQIQEFCFTNQNHKTPYIIALTADIIKNKKEDYYQFGMNDYISKPYKIEDINTSLKNYLKFENDEI